METETKQVVEKKVYEDGKKNYATKGEALGIGIPALVLGGGRSLAVGTEQGYCRYLRYARKREHQRIRTAANGTNAPTAFQTWEKECSDALALTNELWGMKLNTEREMYAHRETDVREKHELWRSQINADFGLYKSQRDLYDVLNERYAEKFNALDKKVAVLEATRPYQDRLIQCEIDRAFNASVNYTDKKTCRAIYGVVGLPSTPTVTVLEGANPFGCNCPAQASSTPRPEKAEMNGW